MLVFYIITMITGLLKDEGWRFASGETTQSHKTTQESTDLYPPLYGCSDLTTVGKNLFIS